MVVSHSWDLVGAAEKEPLLALTDGRLVCSAIGLCGFFTISGYLVYISLMKSRTVGVYVEKRWLRIFPGLIICFLFTLFACSLVYRGTGCYWLKSGTWNYLWGNLTLYDVRFTIPGVFEDNPYPMTINGSIWTLCYEFTMYLLIIPLFFMRDKKTQMILPIIALMLILIKNVLFLNKFEHTTFMSYMNLNQFCRFAQFFIFGMMIAILEQKNILKEKWEKCNWLLAVCIILFVGCIMMKQIAIGMVFMSVLFIQVGKKNWQPVSQFVNKIGDLSYGIYIYSFVIQQLILHKFPNTPPYIVLIISVLCVAIVAYASWHLVEKKALKLKEIL